MKRLTADELRQQYLQFFKDKGHAVLPSAPLVPHGDPTLLLTGAGMIPFKPYFLGHEQPPYKRVTTCQRCLRTVDFDHVGMTDRHGTFFEMLGNFSFGDYFKEEVIPWAWEFVTEHLELPEQKLWVSIYHDDDEAFAIWNGTIGVPESRIVRLGREDNFWQIGVGPCGPCSEIYLDRGREHGCDDPHCKPGCDCDRFLEIWNLVFIQFYQDERGELTTLERKGIDTGMGMERTAALLQDVKSIFEIDVIRPVLDTAAGLAGVEYGSDSRADVSLRVITDHCRGIAFLVHDGVLPSNEGRGYVLRRLLRRAARHGRLLGIAGQFLNRIVDVVLRQMRPGYPELEGREEFIKKVVGLEEQRFHETLDQGTAILKQLMEKERQKGSMQISGRDAFRLYDTFGFPLELTREMAAEQGFSVDEDSFAEAMEAQRQRARAARSETGYLGEQVEVYKALQDQGGSEFVGYTDLQTDTSVMALVRDNEPVEAVGPDQHVVVVLAETPFYPEGGGQVADQGVLIWEQGRAEVKDVKRPLEGVVAHHAVIKAGTLEVGDGVQARVAENERWDTARHHTATHLLHKALKDLLGDHVNQSGSYVGPDRLRFDFTHLEALTGEELRAVERRINEVIMSNYPVESSVKDLEAAKEMGAMALFGEKYGSAVRVIQIGDYSLELCGGTHVPATGSVGLLRIVSEGSVAAGVRRIEAVAGRLALDALQEMDAVLEQTASVLNTAPESLADAASRVVEQRRGFERELQQLRQKLSASAADDLVQSAETIGDVSLLISEVDAADMEELRNMGDSLRNRLQPAVVFLGTRNGSKVNLVGMISKDIAGPELHAGDVVRTVAQICGGGGGGRPDMAQAGGKKPDKLPEALSEAAKIFRERLEGIQGRVEK